MNNRDVVGEMGKTLVSLVATLLTIGGVIVILIGAITGRLWLAIVGVLAIVLAQVAQSVSRKQLARDLEEWATEAVLGLGPVPPAPVRMAIAKTAMRSEGLGGDFHTHFMYACREWSAAQG